MFEVLSVLFAPVEQGCHVSNGGIEPDVEKLAWVVGDLEAEIRGVARYVPGKKLGIFPEPFEQFVGYVRRHVRFQPVGEEVAEHLQIEKNVLAVADLGFARVANGAMRVFHVCRRVCIAAFLAGVAVLVFGAAFRARATDKTIRQEHLVIGAVELRDILVEKSIVFLEAVENGCAEIEVFGGIGCVVVIELDFEICEVLDMALVALGDQLLWGNPLLSRTYHDRCAVRVVCAHVNAFVTAHLLESYPKICLQVLYEMPYVYVPVCVRQG